MLCDPHRLLESEFKQYRACKFRKEDLIKSFQEEYGVCDITKEQTKD